MPFTITRTQLLLAGSALAVLAAAFWMWSPAAPAGTQAATTGAKPQMDLVITGTLGLAAVNCNSATQSKCSLETGSSFTVEVVPSTIPVSGYAGWQTLISYGSLLYKPRGLSQELTFSPNEFPVRLPQQPSGKEGSVVHFAITAGFPSPGGLFPVSMQKSTFLTLNFNCAQNAGGNFGDTISIIDFNEDLFGGVFIEPDGVTLHVPNVGSLDVNCQTTDTDQDGCTDVAENGPNPQFGGQRNHLYFWDFYDVWTETGPMGAWERDKVLNVFDILATALRFGPGDGPPVDKQAALAAALTEPVARIGYHVAYDRSGLVGPNQWDKGPPDGVINLTDDILGVAFQFGHDCT